MPIERLEGFAGPADTLSHGRFLQVKHPRDLGVRTAVEKEFQSLQSVALPSSILTLFSDRVVKEIPFSDIQSIRETFTDSGGGTDFTLGLEAAIEKLKDMLIPRILLFFTDGEDSLDVPSMCQKFRSAGVQLTIYEAVGSQELTLLQKLTRICDGEYQRM